MTDPREYYARAAAQTQTIVAAVRPDQLELATPCPDYDVRALLSHIVGGVNRTAIVGEGGVLSPGQSRVDGVADDEWPEAYRASAKRAEAAWADEAKLNASFAVPWGTVPGRVALSGYTQEVLIHGWDLAKATGQPTQLDPELASWVLDIAQRILPAEPRGGPVPFGPVVPVDADAEVYARLAGWLGRQP
jgi:uncharacterized protein (TIGR03086 family)